MYVIRFSLCFVSIEYNYSLVCVQSSFRVFVRWLEYILKVFFITNFNIGLELARLHLTSTLCKFNYAQGYFLCFCAHSSNFFILIGFCQQCFIKGINYSVYLGVIVNAINGCAVHLIVCQGYRLKLFHFAIWLRSILKFYGISFHANFSLRIYRWLLNNNTKFQYLHDFKSFTIIKRGVSIYISMWARIYCW